MKKILIIITVILPFLIKGQNMDTTSINDLPSVANQISPPIYSVNLVASNPSQQVINLLNSKISDYKIYKLDHLSFDSALNANQYNFDFEFKVGGNSTSFSLQRKDIRSDNYIETKLDALGNSIQTINRELQEFDITEIKTLAGFANKNKSLPSRFAIYKDRIEGYIYTTEGINCYKTLNEFAKEAGVPINVDGDYIIYYDLNSLKESVGFCGVEFNDSNSINQYQNKGYFEKCTPRFLEIAAEGDHWWCNTWGANSSQKILDNLFFVEALYTHNFNISFVVNRLDLLTGNTTLYNTTNSVDKIQAFANNWNANRSFVQRDVAILYSGLLNIDGVLGNAFLGSLCDKNRSYMTVTNSGNRILICAHELGHIFGSLHDNGTSGYGSSACSGTDIPIMCASAIALGSRLNFSVKTRDIILNSINLNAGCLNGSSLGTPVSLINKTWSNFKNNKWVGSWHLNDNDIKLIGNFDGDNDDEEIFFTSSNKKWVGIMDFSCDQGTDWYHLWGNNGTSTFGSWVRNNKDRFVAGDFNGDGKDEVLTISGSNKWFAIQEYDPNNWSWIFRCSNMGNGTISTWVCNSNDTYLTFDYDGDGKDELLCINPNGWGSIINFSIQGSLFIPQTIWSNMGNGWIGGVQISNTDRWIKGKFTNLLKDELFTVSNTWVSTQSFNGTSWTWIWSQYGANNFASMHILPINAQERILAGNFDSDAKDEIFDINSTWSATADFNNGNFQQNWNNAGTSMIHDWNLFWNPTTEFYLIKAAPTSNKQLITFGRVNSQKWLSSMYKGNSTFQNFKIADTKKIDEESTIVLYPNPSIDMLNIEMTNIVGPTKYIIRDNLGVIIKDGFIDSRNRSIDIRGFKGGIYFITIVNNNFVKSIKFIKQ